MSALAATLRISRRDALRARKRSALIMTMIFLPVFVITALMTGYATYLSSPVESLTHDLGAADAYIDFSNAGRPISQGVSGDSWEPVGDPPPDGQRTSDKVKPSVNGRLIPYEEGALEIRSGDDYTTVRITTVDLRDPMTRGMRPLSRGRVPAAPDEVVVSPSIGDIGSTLKVTRSDLPARVVGIIDSRADEVAGLPGAFPAMPGSGPAWLLDAPGPVLWNEVRALNAQGFVVRSRAVLLDPPAEARPDSSFHSEAEVRSFVVNVVVAVMMIVTETALLAGPAFAVGLRRRRGELALIAAQGGSPRHLRGVVLADGFVLGGLASVAGVVLGVGSGLVLPQVLSGWLREPGPPDVPWAQVLGVGALGLVSATIAALVPAVQAGRQDPAAVLAGRTAEPPARRRAGRPLLGLLFVLAGLALTGVGLSNGDGLTKVIATPLVMLGLIALMPWLVVASGRLAARLPLPLRLSVRDGARHRVRTACAAAAVMAATAAVIAAGIVFSSDQAASQESYEPDGPPGSTLVVSDRVDEANWAKVRQVAARRLPGAQPVTGMSAFDAKGALFQLTGDGRVCGYACYDLPIGDDRLLEFLQGRRDPVAAAALAAGKAVVFGRTPRPEGLLEVAVRRSGDEKETRIRVPAVWARGVDPRQGGGVLPASVARQAGLRAVERRLYAQRLPADRPLMYADLQAVGRGIQLRVVRAVDSDAAVLLWILMGGATVLVLGGTFAATGLAAADMRPDLVTMSAIGAPRRTRRLVVAGQAAHVAGLGALVGLPAGIVTGVALAWNGAFSVHESVVIAVPWAFLAGVVVGLPLLAALVAGLFARTRLTPARRLT